MYPPVTQFQSSQSPLEREHLNGPQADRSPSRPRGRPPRYKLALLTWAAAYAVITLMLESLGPTMASWPLELRTLVISFVMVVSLTWLFMPALTRLFRPWLDPAAYSARNS